MIKWIDLPPKIYSECHRQFKHTEEVLEEQFKKWDHYEILAAKIHIIRDVDVFVLQKPMEQVEIEEIDELYEQAISNYCHW